MEPTKTTATREAFFDAMEFISALKDAVYPSKDAKDAYRRYINNQAVSIAHGIEVASVEDFIELWNEMNSRNKQQYDSSTTLTGSL